MGAAGPNTGSDAIDHVPGGHSSRATNGARPAAAHNNKEEVQHGQAATGLDGTVAAAGHVQAAISQEQQAQGSQQADAIQGSRLELGNAVEDVLDGGLEVGRSKGAGTFLQTT